MSGLSHLHDDAARRRNGPAPVAAASSASRPSSPFADGAHINFAMSMMTSPFAAAAQTPASMPAPYIASMAPSPRSGSPVPGSMSPRSTTPPPTSAGGGGGGGGGGAAAAAAAATASLSTVPTAAPARRNFTPVSILSPPSSSTTFSPGAASSIVSAGQGQTLDEVPMLPSTSRTTFAPSGELLIDGLGVDGRDLSKGEAGWAEPFSPTLAVTPTTRRFSTRPSIADPTTVTMMASGSTSVLGLTTVVASPPSATVALPDVGVQPAVLPHEGLGSCNVPGCAAGDAEALRQGAGTIGNITIFDIVDRRTCRPISLQDLRAHLLAQRALHAKDPNAALDKKTQFPDLSLLGGTPTLATAGSSDWISEERDPEKTLTNSLASGQPSSSRRPARGTAGRAKRKKSGRHQRSATSGDDVDALDFIAVFNRYQRRFNALPRAQRIRSPDPALFSTAAEESIATGVPATAAAAAPVARAGSVRRDMEGAVTVELTLRSSANLPGGRSESRLGQTASIDFSSCAPLRKEVALFPSSQPLREQFDDILSRFLGRPAGNDNSLVSEKDGQDEKHILARKPRSPTDRLRWMVDIGLVSQEQISQVLAEADLSTHPQVLAPLADKVAVYLNDHIVPDFLEASTSNLSRGTQLGRLAVGLSCTTLAILFTVLLVVNPSPFRPRPHADPQAPALPSPPHTDVSRWWRLLTAPLWCAGIGYVLAAWTGVCVWLTIRGNHEPGDEDNGEPMSEAEWEGLMLEEEMDRNGTVRSGGLAASPSDSALPWSRPDRKSLMAPELLNLLRRMVFLKPLPGNGSSAASDDNDADEKGLAAQDGTTSGVQPNGAVPPFQQRTEISDGHISPALSRVTSLNTTGGALGLGKLEPVSESKSVNFERPLSPSSMVTTTADSANGAGMSSIGQVAASAIPPPPPITPRMGSFPNSLPSPHALSPHGRASMSSPGMPPLPGLPPVSPMSAGLWRSPSAGTGMTMTAPSVSVKSKKVPVLPVAVGLVQTNVPAPLPPAAVAAGSSSSSSSSAPGRRKGLFFRRSEPNAVLPTIVPSETSASRAPSLSHADGIAYASSLYNVAGCRPQQAAPRRVVSAAWVSVRRWTGFAVNTKPVLDSRVRAAQQRAALQSLLLCFGTTAVVLIVITALP
ncbi:hypothetical protein OC835_002972 [Tilletia horrida]|nr:hypothetical protein OC835_002972 [Tilletia horrida]